MVVPVLCCATEEVGAASSLIFLLDGPAMEEERRRRQHDFHNGEKIFRRNGKMQNTRSKILSFVLESYWSSLFVRSSCAVNIVDAYQHYVATIGSAPPEELTQAMIYSAVDDISPRFDIAMFLTIKFTRFFCFDSIPAGASNLTCICPLMSEQLGFATVFTIFVLFVTFCNLWCTS